MTRDKLNYVPGSFEDIGEEPLPSQVVPDQPDEDGQPEQREPASTIYEAAAQGNLELVQAFMEEGWDTRSLDESGMAPLHYAARGGHHEIVTCLLRDGNAHIDQYSIRNNRQSSTALHFAAEAGKKSVVHSLLHRGAKVEARQNDLVNGPTALHLAAYRNHIDVVKLLCGDKRAPTTMRAQFPDPDKWRTPLEVARDELHHEIVEIIRAQGG